MSFLRNNRVVSHLLTPEEMAVEQGVHPRTLAALRRRGLGPAYVFIGRGGSKVAYLPAGVTLTIRREPEGELDGAGVPRRSAGKGLRP